MSATPRDARFDRTLAKWVKGVLARGVRSFPELVAALPGAYPADVVLVLQRLRCVAPNEWQNGPPPPPRRASSPAGWPVEHPLDFDWRFTTESVRFLLDRCGDGSPLAFLGAPSLAREAAERGGKGVILFDRNPAMIGAVRSAQPGCHVSGTDLLWDAPVEIGEAATSVADPPWYPEHISAFLWAAARVTRVGGRVLLSLPPEGTRPGIPAERETVLAVAGSLGLRLESIEPGVLAYLMPPFEWNALAAAGVPAVSRDWRKGDLAVFTLSERTDAPRPVPAAGPEGWNEVSVGAVRIKCRSSSSNEFGDPTLSRVVPDDMLNSVSRRHPARSAADVWTTGNRIFRCAAPDIFRVIVSALARSGDTITAVSAAIGRELTGAEAALVVRAVEQAVDLIRREERELTEYADRCHEGDLAEAI